MEKCFESKLKIEIAQLPEKRQDAFKSRFCKISCEALYAV